MMIKLTEYGSTVQMTPRMAIDAIRMEIAINEVLGIDTPQATLDTLTDLESR